MEKIKINNYKETRFKTGIALGNFDGVHLGHKKIVTSMVEESKTLGFHPSVMLFSKHPKEVLFGESPKLITSSRDKEEIFKGLGIKTIYEIDFDNEFRKLSPEDFVKEILVDKLNVNSVFVGFDYKFGYKASGNVETLKKLADKNNFIVNVLDPVYDEKRVLSSSEIRELIKKGEIELVNEMLDRSYKIRGKVVHGNKIGKTLGFPTANIDLCCDYPIPKIGVYETKTIVDGIKYKSVTSIGTNPTVGGDVVKIETYILDFDKNIYDEEIEVEFCRYLRDELVFDNLEDLKRQMGKDVNKVK